MRAPLVRHSESWTNLGRAPVRPGGCERQNMVGTRFFELLHEDRREEVLSSIFAHVEDHRCIEACSAVCTIWRCVARQEDLWSAMCNRLWASKVYIPSKFEVLRATGHARKAFIGSFIDSKRTTMKLDEITSSSFRFRFKESAGSYWTDQDPFWQKQDPILVTFNADGSVAGFPWDILDITWNFVDDDGKVCAERGSLVGVSVNQRVVPRYTVSRHTNWGFILQAKPSVHTNMPQRDASNCSRIVLQNCWVAYFSFPMPPIGVDPSLDDMCARPIPPHVFMHAFIRPSFHPILRPPRLHH